MIGLITWGQPSEATGSRHERGRRVWRPGGVRGDNKTVVRPALETVALTRKPEAGLEVVELKMLQPVCVDACEGDRGIQETELFVSETVIIISSVCATYQTIPAEGALRAPVHLCRRTGRWSSAPHFHASPAEGKCAHLPPLVCGHASNPHRIVLLFPYQAEGHLHLRGEAGLASVDNQNGM